MKDPIYDGWTMVVAAVIGFAFGCMVGAALVRV